MRESNSRPPAPEAGIIPLDQSPSPHKETKKEATVTRFELARAEPSRFRIYLLNHLDTVPVLYEMTHRIRVIGLVV
jgi:hypothetical protein